MSRSFARWKTCSSSRRSTDIIASKCKFTSPPLTSLSPPSPSSALSSAAICRMATAFSAVGSLPSPLSSLLLVSFSFIDVEMEESTRLWANGDAPIENDGAARWGECTNHPCHGAADSANNCSRTAQQRSNVPPRTEGRRRIAGGIIIFK